MSGLPIRMLWMCKWSNKWMHQLQSNWLQRIAQWQMRVYQRILPWPKWFNNMRNLCKSTIQLRNLLKIHFKYTDLPLMFDWLCFARTFVCTLFDTILFGRSLKQWIMYMFTMPYWLHCWCIGWNMQAMSFHMCLWWLRRTKVRKCNWWSHILFGIVWRWIEKKFRRVWWW